MTTDNEQDYPQIPAELKAAPNWIAWKWETRKGETERTKPPYNVKTGKYASVSDPSTWASYDEVESATDAFSGNDYDGKGIVLHGIQKDGVPLAGFDFDGVAPDGKPEPFVLDILEKLSNPYCEITPSGNGLRGFVFAHLPKNYQHKFLAKKPAKYGIEIYGANDPGRYLTVTANHYSGKGLPTIEDISLAYFMISQIQNSKLKSLWMGDMSVYDNDHSRADMALLSILAWLVNYDAQRVKTYFLASKLGQRDKSAVREDYLDRTIKKILSDRGKKPVQSEPTSAVPATPATPAAPAVPLWDVAVPFSAIADTPLKMVIPDILAEGESTMLTGNFASFKTYLSYFLADAISEGGEFINRTAEKHPVLLLDRENSKSTVSLRRYLVGNLRDKDNVRILGRFTTPSAVDLTNSGLLDLCRTVHPVIIIDSAQDFHPDLKENDADDMTLFTAEVNGLIDAGAVAVLIIHHVPASGGKKYRGSTAIAGGFGAALFAEKIDRTGVRISGFKTRDGEDCDIELQMQFPSKAATDDHTGRVTYKVIRSGIDRLGELDARIIQHVRDNDGCSGNDVAKTIGGNKSEVLARVNTLIDDGKLTRNGSGAHSKLGIKSTGSRGLEPIDQKSTGSEAEKSAGTSNRNY